MALPCRHSNFWHQQIWSSCPRLTGAPAVPPSAQADSLQGARPVLLRALVREEGLVHEVVATLDVSAFGTSQVWGRQGRAARQGLLEQACIGLTVSTVAGSLCPPGLAGPAAARRRGWLPLLDPPPPSCPLVSFTPQVLRLEPHVVVSNRTSVPLQLLQSRLDFIAPQAAAGGAAAGGLARPSGPVVAEGGSSFSQSSRSMNAALLTGSGACAGSWPRVVQAQGERAASRLPARSATRAASSASCLVAMPALSFWLPCACHAVHALKPCRPVTSTTLPPLPQRRLPVERRRGQPAQPGLRCQQLHQPEQPLGAGAFPAAFRHIAAGPADGWAGS